MIALVVAAPLAMAAAAGAQGALKRKPPDVVVIRSLIGRYAGNAEIVNFADRGLKPVKVVRGQSRLPSKPLNPGVARFANLGVSASGPVGAAGAADQATARDAPATLSDRPTSELVTFADPHEPAVTVLRGASLRSGLPPPTAAVGFFGPAGAGALDRAAFAIDGAESSHGADLRMWRPELDGPQGPMQVSAAAATDIGGGDRFDIAQNRLLGRAYLALLFRRYGSWPDAIAAYNWGPGNMDWWIGNGRQPNAFPFEVERYRDRVLRDMGIAEVPVPPPVVGR
jgi:Transglycosylase SLT domain